MTNDILKIAKKHEKETADFLIDLVKTPSLSGNEKSIVDRIKKEMGKIGFDKIWVDGLGSIVGELGTGKKKLAFDAHIDTVDIGNRELWDFDPFDAHEKNGKIWGRGTADQKGGFASMMCAARIIKELDLAKDATMYFVGSVLEENYDGLCWDYLISKEGLKPDLCILTEPTNLKIVRGQRGRLEIDIIIKGKSCHGSAPERGDNAIYKTALLVSNIKELHNHLHTDPFLGQGSIAVTGIKSNSPSLCAIPDICKIHLDRRLTMDETLESAVNEIETLPSFIEKDMEIIIPEYNALAYTEKKYPAKAYMPTWIISKDHAYLKTAKETYKALFEKDPNVGCWIFSTNGVSIMGKHNIPCIGFGPGKEEQAHTANEWINKDDLHKAAAFYASFAEKFTSSKD